jgi:MFS family permease
MGDKDDSQRAAGYGWVVLGALMFVFLALYAPVFFGASVLNVAMAAEFKLPRGAIGAGFSLLSLASGLPGPLVALFMGRYGARGAIILGSLLIAGASVLMATLVTGAIPFVAVFGGLGGIGLAFSTAIPAQTAITQWFSTKRALAVSLLWVTLSVGGALVAPIFGRLVAAGNWRLGWWATCSLALTAAVVAALAVKEAPGTDAAGAVHAHGAPASRAKRVYMTEDAWTLAAALRIRAYWSIVGAFAMVVAAIICTFAYLILYLRDMGYGIEFSASALGLVAIGQIVGKLSVGALGDRVEPRFLWAAGLLLMATGFLLSTHAVTPLLVHVFVFALGLGYGISLVAAPTMLGNYFGSANYVRLYGTLWPLVTIISSASPTLIGFSYGWTHGYGAGFLALAVLLAACAALIFLTSPPVFSSMPKTERVHEAVTDSPLAPRA